MTYEPGEARVLDEDDATYLKMLPTMWMGVWACKFILKNGVEERADYILQVTQDAAGDLWIEATWKDEDGFAFRADAIVSVERISKKDPEGN